MNKLLTALMLLALSGCAAVAIPTTSQNYRAKGNDEQLKITGKLIYKKNLLIDDYAVLFNIDNDQALAFQLDNNGNGSLSCTKPVNDDKQGQFYCYPHKGNKIGATCNGSTVNGILASSLCTFTYNNEIAANFKF